MLINNQVAIRWENTTNATIQMLPCQGNDTWVLSSLSFYCFDYNVLNFELCNLELCHIRQTKGVYSLLGSYCAILNEIHISPVKNMIIIFHIGSVTFEFSHYNRNSIDSWYSLCWRLSFILHKECMALSWECISFVCIVFLHFVTWLSLMNLPELLDTLSQRVLNHYLLF